MLISLAVILVPPVVAFWVSIIAVPKANNALPNIDASIKLSVNGTTSKFLSITDNDIDNPKAAYKLFIPKLLPRNINANANSTTLHMFITIPVLIPSNLFITRANPDIPPDAISFGKKKNCNDITTIAIPNVIIAYSFNFFIISSYIF
ncbi:exported hypothetical protein [Clostridium neonatale]|nr:exported hypothetical protein [Clostridium neonatale]CAI3720402.1 exported hypothetical protein [Clostridium neonatale]CAI3721446.1 exported hypothetical protein [Clostridium neonatale]